MGILVLCRCQRDITQRDLRAAELRIEWAVPLRLQLPMCGKLAAEVGCKRGIADGLQRGNIHTIQTHVAAELTCGDIHGAFGCQMAAIELRGHIEAGRRRANR